MTAQTNTVVRDSDILNTRLQDELRLAWAGHVSDGPGRVVHARLPLRLMERASRRTGIHSEEDLLRAALVHLVMDGDRLR